MYLHKIKLACLVLCTICATFLFFDTAFAATASISTTGTVSIDVSNSGNSANIGIDTLTVNTTCASGYTVSISSSQADTKLYKDGDATSTNYISPVSGTASILGENLGTWGYSLSSEINGNFIGLTNANAILTTKSTASAGSGDQIPVYYGVSVSPSIPTGTYTMSNNATIVYQLTMPAVCEPYIIKYNGNNADSGTTMSLMHTLEQGQNTDLAPSNFKRAGYGFAGWSTTQLNPDAANATQLLASTKIYGPMENVTLDSTLMAAANSTTHEITMYAVWVKPTDNLQNWAGCSSLASGAVTALTDTRDNNVYAIAKLADGNCWMIENLRLGGSSAMNLTATDTAIASDITLPASTNTFTTGSGAYETIQMSAKNTLEAPTNMTTLTDAEVYSYGNYYSWPAAIGSTTAYSTNNQSVNTSICPSGWHLPKGGDKSNESNNEFWKLIVTNLNGGTPPANSATYYPYYAGTTEAGPVEALLRKYPNNFIRSGHLIDSVLDGRGGGGAYWSSTVNSSDFSYFLGFGAIYVSPGTDNEPKYVGLSVRCVADEKPQPLNCPAGNICYSANATGVETRMVNQAAANDSEVALWAPNFKRDGYGFAGWSTEMENHDFGPKYGPNETIYTGDLSGGGIPLYAMWIPSAGNIQNWNGCPAMNIGDVTALTDTRDNNTYAVAKLADGKCWMIENMRLGGTSPITLTPSDSNVSSNFTLSASVSPTTTAWCTTDNAACINKSMLSADNVLNAVDSMTNNNSNVVSYGNYYNWYSATAGTGTYSVSSGNVKSSICPASWHLPTGNTSGEFRALDIAIGGTGDERRGVEHNPWLAYPTNIVRAASISGNGDKISFRGSSNNYWSSTAHSNGHAHTLYSTFIASYGGDVVSPGVGNNGYTRTRYGFSVRCVR